MSDEITEQYKLRKLESNGWVYIEIQKGILGLQKVGRMTNDRLNQHMKGYIYDPVPRTLALWKYDKHPTIFTLVVDDFGIKYVDDKYADHLLHALCDKKKCSGLDRYTLLRTNTCVGLSQPQMYTVRDIVHQPSPTQNQVPNAY